MSAQQQQLQQDMTKARDAVSEALAYASKLGASSAECALTHSRGLTVDSRLGEVETVEFNQDGSLGITVYRGQCKGAAATADLTPEAVRAAVTKANEIARYTSEDPFAGLADASLMATEYPDLELYFDASMEPEYAAEQAQRCERAALSDERIINSDGANYSSHAGFRVYGNSHGFLGNYMSSRQSLSCVLIGKQGDTMERDYAYTLARNPSLLESAEEVARQAVENTVSRLGARSLGTCQVPVIFQNDVANGLFGHLVAAISGGSLYRKSSFLLDSLNTQVLPEWLSITEDPHVKGGLASSPFDHEGVATQARDIIDRGQLNTYLLTSYAARKMNMQVTGHAGGIHNWLPTYQDYNLDALCKKMGTGLLVTELMGQGVNIVTGDYSRGAAGFWVENGEIQYPVSEITIAGNLKDMFANMVAMSNDIDKRHGVQAGSVLIEQMKVAGN
ncbi:metalloprotease PmbA [Aliidiomarina minuta]|uniref:Metalloprotease PmbA n=1 Tax=Aliidiomarina minuta TaxID=880057 RepID=A0A432W992_9GAMM|nr:metalloprotease PmbA [Aliidiomarina minuta]RUO26662.1 metalloprotease PmbA [Aliidiomarina minuta]